LVNPHLRIAAHLENLARGDSGGRAPHLHRAEALDPPKARVWVVCGRLELLGKQTEAGVKSWKGCLGGSADFLGPIVQSGINLFTPVELMEKLLPKAPLTLIAAYRLLPADSEREAMVVRALELFDKQPRLSAAEFHEKGVAHSILGQRAQAL